MFNYIAKMVSKSEYNNYIHVRTCNYSSFKYSYRPSKIKCISGSGSILFIVRLKRCECGDVIVRVLFRYYDVMSQVLLTFLHLYCDILTAMLGFEFLL